MEANQQDISSSNNPLKSAVGDRICNFCNSGCCSLPLEAKESRGNQADNRCAESDDSMEGSRKPQDECRCGSSLPGELRYLTGSDQPVRPNGMAWGKANEEMVDEELLHVLVTRPEIAGKPKDNIVFEGDMDLRTTFETSYEALARMRLDCWRRHQELASRGCCKSASTNGIRRAKVAEQTQATKGSEFDSDEQLICMENAENQQQQVVSVAADTASEQLVATDGKLESRSVGEPASNLGNPEARACHQSSGGGGRVDAAVQVDLACQTLPNVTTTTPHQQQLHTKNQIDPDLTPIIVYDANMNRLEKVGLRKRSKYRPSTSLRSGARGLFGDQELEQEPRGGNSDGTSGSCQTQSIKQASGAASTAAAAEVSQKYNNRQPQTPMQMAREYNNMTSRLWDPEPTIETELALDARNLKDSRQKDYLMFSGGNLPVDSKRKLRGNVNMIDHIKEQNIVEKSAPVNELREQNYLAFQESQHQDHPNQNQDMLEESEESLKLAKQEEEAAMEELRKITENPVQDTGTRDTNEDRIVSEEENDDKNVRKSRLKRTCQNQNFDIYNNDYQEEAGPEMVTRMDERGTRLSPQSKLYTNLFRESPDFIMTTGKFMDQEIHHQRG